MAKNYIFTPICELNRSSGKSKSFIFTVLPYIVDFFDSKPRTATIFHPWKSRSKIKKIFYKEI